MYRFLLLISSGLPALISCTPGISQYDIRSNSPILQPVDSTRTDSMSNTWRIPDKAMPYSKMQGMPGTGAKFHPDIVPSPNIKSTSNFLSLPNKDVPFQQPEALERDSQFSKGILSTSGTKVVSSYRNVTPSKHRSTKGDNDSEALIRMNSLEKRHLMAGKRNSLPTLRP